MRRITVHITGNFDENLAGIRRFLEEEGATPAFESLLTQLFETVIPNLKRFPELGVDFLAKPLQSTEGLMRLEILKKRLGKNTALREYIGGDYLLLYAVRGDDVYLLSIMHHRQLSFDLKAHWGR